MESRVFHVIHKYSNLNCDISRYQLGLRTKNCPEHFEKYFSTTLSPHVLWNGKIIDDLSRLFARLISTELQFCKFGNFIKKQQLFVSTKLNEDLHQIDIYSNSKNVSCKIDELLNTNSEFETRTNWFNNQKKRTVQNINKNLSLNFLVEKTGYSNIISSIARKNADVSKNLFIWSVISDSNIGIKNNFTYDQGSIFLNILEALVSTLFYQIQREYMNIENLEINLILIIKYSKNLFTNFEKKPIIVTNQSNNNQIKITCLDSRYLLNYSDVLLSLTLNTLMIKLDFSHLNSFDSNDYLNSNAIFFVEKNKALLNYIERKDNNDSNKKQENSSYICDSEEGEIFEEQEKIITLLEDEFNYQGWSKLIDVIHFKVLGKIPIQWNPTASEVFRLSSPVGRNSQMLISRIYNLVNIGSLLLGKNEVPFCALICNIPIFKDQDLSLEMQKKKNGASHLKILNSSNKLTNKFMIRNICSLVTINRNPILPIPISRNFHCECKINNTCNIEVTELEKNNFSFAVKLFGDLFKRLKDSVKLIISVDSQNNSRTPLISNSLKTKNKELLFRKSLFKIKNNEELSKLLNFTFALVPILFADLQEHLFKPNSNLIENDEFDDFKIENLMNEKLYFENNFGVKNLKLVDVLFPYITIGISRKQVFESYMINRPAKKNGQLIKKYVSEKEVLLLKLNDFFSNLLGENPFESCLLKCNHINDEKIKYILENRDFVKHNSPKIFWLSLNILIHSLKFISKEHQRIFYIISSRKDFNHSNQMMLPILKGSNSNTNSSEVFDSYFDMRSVYFQYKNASYSQIKQINKTRNVNYKKLDCE